MLLMAFYIVVFLWNYSFVRRWGFLSALAYYGYALIAVMIFAYYGISCYVLFWVDPASYVNFMLPPDATFVVEGGTEASQVIAENNASVVEASTGVSVPNVNTLSSDTLNSERAFPIEIGRKILDIYMFTRVARLLAILETWPSMEAQLIHPWLYSYHSYMGFNYNLTNSRVELLNELSANLQSMGVRSILSLNSPFPTPYHWIEPELWGFPTRAIDSFSPIMHPSSINFDRVGGNLNWALVGGDRIRVDQIRLVMIDPVSGQPDFVSSLLPIRSKLDGAHSERNGLF
uniref:Orf287 n=1 Tax=Monoblepharella sp. JEL15 TaxID=224130 RepID=Q85MC8_9FUNG|nr:orf287 [Monoblepharella sp. JEL15]AAO64954.1 orf287 [Monoblepharella sp. JEL15]